MMVYRQHAYPVTRSYSSRVRSSSHVSLQLRAALRLLTTALLAASIANAIALPAPDASTNELPSPSDIEAALAVAAEPQENYFDEMEDGLRSRTGLQLVKDFFARLFGFDPDSSDAATTVTVTVSVTPSSSIVTPPGPPSSSSSTADVSTPVTSSNPETTPSPTNDIYSILPVGSMTTAINISLPEPIFSTASSPVPILPPYPANTSLSLTGPSATAATITGYFSTNALETAIPIAVNATTNTTVTLTSEYTSIILVTGTGSGTGLPLLPTDAAAPLWTNSTSAPTPLSTDAAPLGTGIPIYPNTTLVMPIVVNATGSPGTVLNVTLPLTLPTSTSTSFASASGTAADTDADDYGYGGYGSMTMIPPYANGTVAAPTGTGVVGTAVSTSTSTTTTTTTIVEVPTDVAVPVLPVPVEGLNGSLVGLGEEYEDLTPLLRICANPRILSLFYSLNDPSYPVLAPFPGCIPSPLSSSTALPNCTLLGSTLQTCRSQSPTLRILLSIKASPLSSVAGNALFGDPDAGSEPFGHVFGTASSSSSSSPTANDDDDDGFPNLFDTKHTPDTLAETLVSLFGPIVDTASSLSAYPRPLGSDVVLGFDVQVPVQWKGTYQDGRFHDLVDELKERIGGSSAVFWGWVGEMVGRRGVEMGGREGWVEWDGIGM
ncbi:hypothetical protein KJE20_09723 [Pyrenophora tritici-repentis]|uniref:Uncharacterized protein n=1 Tax=Pyrenophora tritici-repentis TaxID=45151 RepID=A0A922N9A1_9PLEO|nr:hypothetical protein Ptr86124_009991 [Pyrenophora tritici-repentis]KAI1680872.1 hypothetical protein KJE20_09723 [Pyrenophora tritici-repentis]